MTNEHLNQWVREVSTHLEIATPSIVLTEKNRGAANRIKTGTGAIITEIVLPARIFEHGEAFTKYYVVHECVHLAINKPEGKHDSAFKEREADCLLRLFNIGIKYNRSFPKYLFNAQQPKVVLWGKSERNLGMGCVVSNTKQQKGASK